MYYIIMTKFKLDGKNKHTYLQLPNMMTLSI